MWRLAQLTDNLRADNHPTLRSDWPHSVPEGVSSWIRTCYSSSGLFCLCLRLSVSHFSCVLQSIMPRVPLSSDIVAFYDLLKICFSLRLQTFTSFFVCDHLEQLFTLCTIVRRHFQAEPGCDCHCSKCWTCFQNALCQKHIIFCHGSVSCGVLYLISIPSCVLSVSPVSFPLSMFVSVCLSVFSPLCFLPRYLTWPPPSSLSSPVPRLTVCVCVFSLCFPSCLCLFVASVWCLWLSDVLPEFLVFPQWFVFFWGGDFDSCIFDLSFVWLFLLWLLLCIFVLFLFLRDPASCLNNCVWAHLLFPSSMWQFSLCANVEPQLYIYFNEFNHKPNHLLSGDRLKIQIKMF